jgi:hypothetical protein
MLICAVLAALAAGVLLGYFLCMGLFRIFMLHARTVVAARKTAKGEAQVASA